MAEPKQAPLILRSDGSPEPEDTLFREIMTKGMALLDATNASHVDRLAPLTALLISEVLQVRDERGQSSEEIFDYAMGAFGSALYQHLRLNPTPEEAMVERDADGNADRDLH